MNAPRLLHRVCAALALGLLGALSPVASAQAVGTEWRTDIGFQTSYAPAISGHHVLGAQGDVYATSNAWGYQTARLDADGNLLWTQTESGGTGTQSLHLALDGQENVIVAGYQEGIGGGFRTSKYAPDGTRLWSRIHSHGLSAEGFRVAVDADDHIYVTGRTFSPLFAFEFLTIKLDPDGNELWWDQFAGFGGEARAIDVTPDGRVMVAGSSGNQLATICYDTDGNLLWSDTHPGLAGAEHGAITDAGDVYVCGTVIVNGTSLGGVLHYEPDGTLAWVGTHNSPGAAWDRYRRLAVHTDGSVVAVGQGGSGYLNWSLVRFDADGQLDWAVLQPDAGSNDGWATDVALDADGAAYVTGFASYGSFGSFVRSLAIKYDAQGQEVWNHPIPCSGYSGSIALDAAAGEVIVSSGSMVSRIGTEPVPLTVVPPAPLAPGGSTSLEFIGFEFPGAYYIAAAAFSATTGFPTSIGHFPLDHDPLLQLSLNDPTGTFTGFTGEIGCDGRTTAPTIQLPANPAISGVSFFVAFAAFPGGIDPGDPGISDTALVTIL